MPGFVNGVRYVMPGDTYNPPVDSLLHAQSDAQQALDAASIAAEGAVVDALAQVEPRLSDLESRSGTYELTLTHHDTRIATNAADIATLAEVYDGMDPARLAELLSLAGMIEGGLDLTDGSMATIVGDDSSATHAALTARHPTRAEFGGLLPGPLADSGIITLGTGAPWVADAIGDTFYGSRLGRVWSSPDQGATWTDVCALPSGASTMLGLRATSDGEVLLVAHAGVWKSSGWGTSAVTWSRKTTSNGLAGPQAFGFDGDGTKFIVGEYGPGAGQAWVDSRYAYISTDAGTTFTQVYDSQAVAPGNAPDASHIHGVCYDPWADVFYVSEGHGPAGGIYHSTDDGQTWHLAPGMAIGKAGSASPTSITATDTGLVCGSDSATSQGVYGVTRTADPMGQQLRWLWAWRSPRSGNNGWGAKGVRDPRTGLVYIAFKSQGQNVAPIIAGGTPSGAAPVWEWPGTTFATEDVFEYLAIDDTGRLLAFATVGGSQHHVHGTLTTPSTTTHPDTGGADGGTAPDATSVAVGQRATASSLRGVAVGVGSQVTQDGVAVGHGSQVTQAGGVAVGRGTSAAAGGTVVGDGAGSTHGQATLVGANAQATGALSVGVGRNTIATETAVAVGHGAQATGLQGVALGYQAIAAGTQSIAIGSGATVTAGLSIAIGRAASVGTSSVALGYNAKAEAIQAVALGEEAKANHNQGLAVGYGASVSGGLSAAIGRNAKAASTGTAIGPGADAAHGNAVALGHNTATTAQNQIQAGARHIEVVEVAEPAAPPTDRARLFIKDGGSGKTQLCVKFATGAVQILATEP